MSTKHQCPECRGKKCFTHYIDDEGGAIVHPSVGRCERLSKCSYHKTPKQYFEANGITPSDTWKAKEPEPEKPVSLIEQSILKQSLSDFSKNCLILFLQSIFSEEQIDEVLNNYLIGSTKSGGTIFWQVDISGDVRTGKIINFNPKTGRRNKDVLPAVTWVHKKLKLKDFNLGQCLFGEHLTRIYPNKPIAIVESEKTAIISSIYFPQFNWLACGGVEQLNGKKLNILIGKSVTLYPDLKCLEKWEDKAVQYGYSVSKTLEEIATSEEKANGLDLADYLVRFKVSDFTTPAPAPAVPIQPQPLTPLPIEKPKTIEIDLPAAVEPKETPYYVSPGWVDFDKTKFKEKETFKPKLWDIPCFDGLVIPQSLRLDAASMINDVPKCINSHLAMLNAHNGNNAYKPYLTRLQKIHSLITQSA